MRESVDPPIFIFSCYYGGIKAIEVHSMATEFGAAAAENTRSELAPS